MDRASSTAVLREALAGSDAALDALYERFGPRLLAFIRLKMGRSLRARLESRDILQATFLKSFQHLDDFEGQRRPIAARLADAHRRARDPRSRRLPRPPAARRASARTIVDAIADVLAARSRSALSRLILDEQAERLEAALESLTDAHREVILLRAFEELSFPGDRAARSASPRTRAACCTRAR